MHTQGNGKWVSTKSWDDPQRIRRKSWHFRRVAWRDECWFFEQNETQWNTAEILKQICFMRHWLKQCWNHDNHHFCRSKRRMNRSRQFNHRGPGIHRARSPSEQGPRQLGLRNLGPLAAFLGGKKEPWEEENTTSIRHPQITEDVDSCWHHEVSWIWWNVHA